MTTARAELERHVQAAQEANNRLQSALADQEQVGVTKMSRYSSTTVLVILQTSGKLAQDVDCLNKTLQLARCKQVEDLSSKAAFPSLCLVIQAAAETALAAAWMQYRSVDRDRAALAGSLERVRALNLEVQFR